jgi:hypothetical protein
MKLTICLVTKGREKHLDQLLESLVPLIADSLNNILIIDNGSRMPAMGQLSAWRDMHSDSVDLVRLEDNDSRPASYWHIVKKYSTDWVIFPGDDDVFHPQIVSEWRSAVRNNPELVAYATSGSVVNSDGKLTGEVLIPSAKKYESPASRIAGALHEPPFLWPGLFMSISKLPLEVPTSRFAFDWWIGLQLLIIGEVEVTDSIGIDYRAHRQQESALAPMRRKFLEDQIWIYRFVSGPEFSIWISSLNNEDKVKIWNQILLRKPIYGDEIFSAPIILTVLEVLDKSINDIRLSSQLFGEYAFSKGVFLKDGEVKNSLRHSGPVTSILKSNISLNCPSNSCNNLIEGCRMFRSESNTSTILVCCKHSKVSSSKFILDCSRFYDGKSDINSDIIAMELTNLLESNGEFNLLLSSGERSFVFQIRKWKGYLPGIVVNFFKRLKH